MFFSISHWTLPLNTQLVPKVTVIKSDIDLLLSKNKKILGCFYFTTFYIFSRISPQGIHGTYVVRQPRGQAHTWSGNHVVRQPRGLVRRPDSFFPRFPSGHTRRQPRGHHTGGLLCHRRVIISAVHTSPPPPPIGVFDLLPPPHPN